MTRQRIAEQAGIAPSTITRLMAHQIQLSRISARKLLSVRPR